jgi:asparagine synthase (glutamine-hydrolysing)
MVDVLAVERLAGLRSEERWGPYRRSLVEDNTGDLFAMGSEYVQRVYLPPLLQRSDRMSMATGVECRVPYLDNEVADLANRLPQSLKRRLFPRREGKILLRRVASGLVPDEIIDRAKYGFAVPLAPWLRKTSAGRDAMAVLREPRARTRPWVPGDELDRITEEHASGVVDASRRIWTLLTLELWARAFVDHEGRAVAHVSGVTPALGSR